MSSDKDREVLKQLQISQKDKDSTVILSGMGILRLPVEISKLKYLRTIDVSRNDLTELPVEMFTTLKLEVLKASNNNLKFLPQEISETRTLTVIHVANNKLTQLPDDICLLDNLKELYIFDNQITKLPENFGNLTNLLIIHMQNNHVKELPLTFGLLKLTELFLDREHMKTPPREVAMKGTKHVINYMKELINGAEPCYRVKLLVVGQENVGKTSLIHRLNGKSKKTISTDGIDIREFKVKAPNPATESKKKEKELKIIFSAWDFAGQELYYTTHQFFMSQRGVYIVVWDIRYEEEKSRVEYWLESIQARVGNEAPVIIVGTHYDCDAFAGNPTKADELSQHLVDRYYSRFPNINAIWLVSTTTGQGIDSLRDKLALISLEMPHMGEMIPKTYLMLEDEIIKLKEKKKEKKLPPIYSWKELSILASEKCCIHTPEDLIVAVSFLHNLGTLLYFEEGSSKLKDIVILDPQWLTDLMASLITTKHRFIKDGILSHTALPQLWKPPMFPKKLHETFLELFEAFEVSYTLPNTKEGEEQSMFPSLLPVEKPDITPFWPPYEPQLITYARQYKLDFIPTGFFSRLMIRMLQFFEPKIYWKNGIIVDEPSKNKAFAELIEEKSRLNVTVRGPNPAKLIRTISEIVEILLNYWYKVETEVFVPCIHCILTKDPHPFRFYLKECEAAAYRGELTIDCRGKDKIRLDQLVPDVAMTEKNFCKINYQKELTMEKQIGKGGFGVIHKGKYRGKYVAIKEISQPDETEDSEKLKAFNEFRKEVYLMSELKHRNIVDLKGFTMNPFCMVMEFLEGGDLYEFIHSETVKQIDWDLKIKLATDIALGMEFLHSITPPLIHRDLKSPNVLLTNTSKHKIVAKVADFGLSSKLFIKAFKQTNQQRSVGNPTWLAPEVMKEEEFSEKADVYAFGIIAWELLTRKHPFDEYDFKMTYMLEDAIKNGVRPTMPEKVEYPKYAALIQQCWDGDPKKRPTFKVILDILLEISKDLAQLKANEKIQFKMKKSSKSSKSSASSMRSKRSTKSNRSTKSSSRGSKEKAREVLESESETSDSFSEDESTGSESYTRSGSESGSYSSYTESSYTSSEEEDRRSRKSSKKSSKLSNSKGSKKNSRSSKKSSRGSSKRSSKREDYSEDDSDGSRSRSRSRSRSTSRSRSRSNSESSYTSTDSEERERERRAKEKSLKKSRSQNTSQSLSPRKSSSTSSKTKDKREKRDKKEKREKKEKKEKKAKKSKKEKKLKASKELKQSSSAPSPLSIVGSNSGSINNSLNGISLQDDQMSTPRSTISAISTPPTSISNIPVTPTPTATLSTSSIVSQVSQ